ncbi:hypothetical protein PHMEG_00041650 [Phytophthora megakarya]|uniref:Crinkler (CRN) n=1 Tax=Phytophthora megakarya TaxID=4795 RepID=A0A225UBG7_9STRA|nr:hypothetical protein PHMEG_00041650 [Phytophthora megakarya]
MAERKDVAYCARGSTVVYFFTFDGNARNALKSDDFLHKYLFACSGERNYINFEKDVCSTVYMNPWTKVECETLAGELKLNDPDEWLRRYEANRDSCFRHVYILM